MPLIEEEEQRINRALQTWRQGDVCLDDGLEFLHLADLSKPHSPASEQAAEIVAAEGHEAGIMPVLDDAVRGLVMLSQTCDVVRSCRERPFVEVAPLIEEYPEQVEAIRRLKRPAFAYVPNIASDHLVADLDRTMTVEKSIVAGWTRRRGWETDDELRNFAQALARKRSRFAFPDDFVAASRRLQQRLADKHDKQTEEGAHLQALGEIRVKAEPSWDAGEVQLRWWFIKEADPPGVPVDWANYIGEWLTRFSQAGRFRVKSAIDRGLEEMSARDYVDSYRLDLDRLSTA